MTVRELAVKAYDAYNSWDNEETFYDLDRVDQDKWERVANEMIEEVGKRMARRLYE